MRREAAEAFAQDVADSLEELHTSAKMQHVVHTLELCWNPADALRPPGGGGGGAGSRPGSAAPGARPGTASGTAGPQDRESAWGSGGQGGVGPSFTMADWADPERKRVMLESLVAAAKHVPQVWMDDFPHLYCCEPDFLHWD